MLRLLLLLLLLLLPLLQFVLKGKKESLVVKEVFATVSFHHLVVRNAVPEIG
jgi:hypothetical protein